MTLVILKDPERPHEHVQRLLRVLVEQPAAVSFSRAPILKGVIYPEGLAPELGRPLVGLSPGGPLHPRHEILLQAA